MNDENLKKGKATQFRSGEEAARNGSKGGKASGISRSFKSALKNKMKENPQLYNELITMLTDEALTEKNLKAAEMLIDLMGESVQRETLALKRKELKLKEEALKPFDRNSTDDGFIEALTGKTEETWNNE